VFGGVELEDEGEFGTTESRSAARFEQSAISIWLSVIQSWRLTAKEF
jgi:hypothetical protein